MRFNYLRNIQADAFFIVKCIYARKFKVLPVDTGRKLNVHKTFRRRPGRLLNVLCTFNLRPVSTGYKIRKIPSLVDFHILYQLLYKKFVLIIVNG